MCLDMSPTMAPTQAMDNSHVSLVSVNLRADGFDKYRCDKALSMGMNLGSMSKILRFGLFFPTSSVFVLNICFALFFLSLVT